MTTLATIVLCATAASGFGCTDDTSRDKTAQFQWEMTVKMCQGGNGQMAMAQEIGKHFPGYSVRKWTCEEFAENKLKAGPNDGLRGSL